MRDFLVAVFLARLEALPYGFLHALSCWCPNVRPYKYRLCYKAQVAFEWESRSFLFLGIRFTSASRLDARLLFLCFSVYKMRPAFRERVYLLPIPSLCSAKRRFTSVVMPV